MESISIQRMEGLFAARGGAFSISAALAALVLVSVLVQCLLKGKGSLRERKEALA